MLSYGLTYTVEQIKTSEANNSYLCVAQLEISDNISNECMTIKVCRRMMRETLRGR
jgi:hypothetical protein